MANVTEEVSAGILLGLMPFDYLSSCSSSLFPFSFFFIVATL